jgi:hypothetical protein
VRDSSLVHCTTPTFRVVGERRLGLCGQSEGHYSYRGAPAVQRYLLSACGRHYVGPRRLWHGLFLSEARTRAPETPRGKRDCGVGSPTTRFQFALIPFRLELSYDSCVAGSSSRPLPCGRFGHGAHDRHDTYHKRPRVIPPYGCIASSGERERLL